MIQKRSVADKRFAVPGVDRDTQLGTAAAALLRAKARPLFELEDAARGGADADAVHDMRVASRRLREAMRLFADLYPRREFRSWYRSVRGVTRALGPVRDSDVFIDSFSRLGTDLGEGGKRCVAYMVGYRIARREEELEALNERLSELDLAESRRSFEALIDAPVTSSRLERPFAQFAYTEVAGRAATVFAAQPAALVESNVEAQHALRIDYKRLRYAVEAFTVCYGEAFGPLHKALTVFQDTLGDLHDLHVFLDALRAPGVQEGAQRAGVSDDDIAEVDALLEWRVHETFVRFVRLVDEHQPSVVLPALLLPLVEPPGTVSPGPRGDTVALAVQAESAPGDATAPASAMAHADAPPAGSPRGQGWVTVPARDGSSIALVVDFVTDAEGEAATAAEGDRARESGESGPGRRRAL